MRMKNKIILACLDIFYALAIVGAVIGLLCTSCYAQNINGSTIYAHTPEYVLQGFKNVKNMGYNVTRLSIINMDAFAPIAPNEFASSSMQEYYSFISQRLDWLDQAIAMAVAQGITPKVVICLWNPSGVVDIKNPTTVIDDQDHEIIDFQNGKMTRMWVAIMNRYKNNPYIIGYDFINEPRSEGKYLSKFYYHLIGISNIINKNKYTFIEPKLGDPSRVSELSPAVLARCKASKCYVSPHFYGMPSITYQGITSANTLCYSKAKRDLAYKVLNNLRSHQLKYGYKILIGEFASSYNSGWGANCHNQPLWAEDIMKYFTSKKWSFWWHDFSVGSVWSPFVSYKGNILEANFNSPTARVLKQYNK